MFVSLMHIHYLTPSSFAPSLNKPHVTPVPLLPSLRPTSAPIPILYSQGAKPRNTRTHPSSPNLDPVHTNTHLPPFPSPTSWSPQAGSGRSESRLESAVCVPSREPGMEELTRPAGAGSAPLRRTTRLPVPSPWKTPVPGKGERRKQPPRVGGRTHRTSECVLW